MNINDLSIQNLSIYQWTVWNNDEPVSLTVIAPTVESAIFKIMDDLRIYQSVDKKSSRHYESTKSSTTSIIWKGKKCNSVDVLVDAYFYDVTTYNDGRDEEPYNKISFEEKIKSTAPQYIIPIIENGVIVNSMILLTHSASSGS
jgi:hypothetical protein